MAENGFLITVTTGNLSCLTILWQPSHRHNTGLCTCIYVYV